MIKLVRVDHRLLHGQVIFSWTRQLEIEHIIVVDDKLPDDPISVMTLNIAKPADCKLSIVKFDKVKETVEEDINKNIMILIKGPNEAVKLVENIDQIDEINYGGIAKKKDSISYSQAIYLNKEELEDTRTLLEKGINIYVQQVPNSSIEKVDFMK